jgi:putative solute:sodium symporter small subunit
MPADPGGSRLPATAQANGEGQSDPASRLQLHWRRTRLLTFLLVAAWLAVVLGLGLFARELEKVRFFGWPLSYYMGAQGALLLFLAIIGVYAWAMRRLDHAAVGSALPADAPETLRRHGAAPIRETERP